MGLFSFQVTGADQTLKGVTSVLGNMQDLTPFWRDVWAPKYFAVVQDLFNTSGSARGAMGRFTSGPWQRWSPKYAVWRKQNAPNGSILTLSGRLRESVRWSGLGLGQEGFFEATATGVTFGTSVPYAAVHQYGSEKKNMPARPFLPTPNAAVFGPLLQQWILKTQAGS